MKAAVPGPVFDKLSQAKQCTPERYQVLAELVEKLGRDRVEVLEVGSWVGYSAAMWRNAISARCPGKGSVLCVDPFEPCYAPEECAVNKRVCRMQEMLEDGSALALFRHNARFGDPDVPVRLLRHKFSDIGRYLRPGLFDIAFIDGGHRYSDVMRDIELAAPLVAPGGFLCGDDLEVQAYETDVEFLKQHRESEIVVQMPNSHRRCHAGVSLAVHEFFGGKVPAKAGAWMVRMGGE